MYSEYYFIENTEPNSGVIHWGKETLPQAFPHVYSRLTRQPYLILVKLIPSSRVEEECLG